MNSALFRPCASNADPVKGGSYLFDRGPNYATGPRYHQGLDVPIGVGTPLYASGEGTVVAASQTNTGAAGWYVTVDYRVAGFVVRVTTMHHSQVNVRVGQKVTLSTVLGLSGGKKGAPGAGSSQGPHLHFEVTIGGVYQDPDKILNPRSSSAGTPGTPIGDTPMAFIPIFYIAASNNPSVTVGKGDIWVRTEPGTPLRRLTQGQAVDYFTLLGLDYNSPNVQSKEGSWFDLAFEEDRVAWGYTVQTHPYLAESPGGGSAPTVEQIRAALVPDFAAIPPAVIVEQKKPGN